jgi:hypothetical protein
LDGIKKHCCSITATMQIELLHCMLVMGISSS